MYMYYVKQLEYCSKMQYTTSSTISSTHLNYCWYSWCTCESCAIIFSQWQVNFLQFHKSSLVIQENEILNFIFLEIFYLEIDMQWHKKKLCHFIKRLWVSLHLMTACIFCFLQVCLEKWQTVPCRLLERKKKRVSTASESSIVNSCCSPWQCRPWPYSGVTYWSSLIMMTKVCGVM